MTKKEYKTLYKAMVDLIAKMNTDIESAIEHSIRWNDRHPTMGSILTLGLDRTKLNAWREFFTLIGYTDMYEIDEEIEKIKERIEYYQRYGAKGVDV